MTTQAKHTPEAGGTQQRHPFSYTIGEGPYRYVGNFDLGRVIAAQNAGNINAANNEMAHAPRLEAGMGTCAHCGHAILNICIVRRGDGKLYGVGSDCIMKVSARGDVSEISKLERQIRKDRSERAKKRRDEKADKDYAAIKPAFDEIYPTFKSHPHPNDYFAGKGKTLADYYDFVLCGSTASQVKIMKAAIAKAKGE